MKQWVLDFESFTALRARPVRSYLWAAVIHETYETHAKLVAKLVVKYSETGETGKEEKKAL